MPSPTDLSKRGDEAQANSDSGEFTLRLDFSPRTLRHGRSVRWLFQVQNIAASSLTLVFGSAQLGDVVLMAEEQVRYRWSKGRTFAEVGMKRDFQPGETWSYALDDALEVNSGRYHLIATVTAEAGPLLTRPMTVTVE